MEKNWFVLKNNHHLGPISKEALLQMLNDGQIDDQSLIWKSGEDDWLPLSHYPELEELSGPPAFSFDDTDDFLPSLPDQNDVPSFHGLDLLPDLPAHDAFLEDTVLPELPKSDLPNLELSELDLPESEFEGAHYFDDANITIAPDQTSTEEIVITESPKLKKVFNKLSLIFALVVLAVLPLSYFALKGPSLFKSRDLSQDRLDLLNDWARSSGSDFSPKIVLNKKGSSLYLATRKSGSFKAYINLVSLDGEVLSSKKVSLTSQAMISKKIGVFNKLKIQTGSSLRPGRYRYHLSMRRSGAFDLLLKKIFKSEGEFTSIPMYGKYQTEFKSSGEILLSKYSDKKFVENLKKYNQQIRSRKNSPLHERIQRYQTLVNLLQKGFEEYQKSLSTIKTGKQIKEFKSYYFKNITMVLQNLIIDNYKISQKWEAKNDAERAAIYQDIFKLGKGIAAFFSEAIDVLEKKGRLKASDRGRISNQMGAKFQALLDRGTLKIEEYELQLK